MTLDTLSQTGNLFKDQGCIGAFSSGTIVLCAAQTVAPETVVCFLDPLGLGVSKTIGYTGDGFSGLGMSVGASSATLVATKQNNATVVIRIDSSLILLFAKEVGRDSASYYSLLAQELTSDIYFAINSRDF